MNVIAKTSHVKKEESVWTKTAAMPSAVRLTTNEVTDVCIIGGGIAGLTVAYMLMKEGKHVTVLDDGPLAGGMTQVTTAHLSNVIDDHCVNIERWHGVDGSRLAAESHAAAINCIEAIAAELAVDCDFQRLDGYLFRASDDGESDDFLERELAAAHRAGIANSTLEASAPFDSFDTGPAIRFPNQARFHPLKYLNALARAIREGGGVLHANSHVDRVEGGKPARIKVGKLDIIADSVIVATNSPINDMFVIHTKQAPYMTYVIGARVPHGSVTDALYWDTLPAYHYVRLQPLEDDAKCDLLIVGGEDHKTGQANPYHRPHEELEYWARERFSMLEEIEFEWGGQYMEPVDGLAFIGRNPLDESNVYVATGDSGMGMTHGTIAGMLLTDLILERSNPWEELYDPSRISFRSAARFVKENLNVAAQYADWLTGSDVESVEEIAPGCGAVLRRGLSKVAVYRDPEGKLIELSAVCPHLQGIVHWNREEATWDCPCHGSRFRPNGEVINGPANQPLAPVDEG